MVKLTFIHVKLKTRSPKAQVFNFAKRAKALISKNWKNLKKLKVYSKSAYWSKARSRVKGSNLDKVNITQNNDFTKFNLIRVKYICIILPYGEKKIPRGRVQNYLTVNAKNEVSTNFTCYKEKHHKHTVKALN